MVHLLWSTASVQGDSCNNCGKLYMYTVLMWSHCRSDKEKGWKWPQLDHNIMCSDVYYTVFTNCSCTSAHEPACNKLSLVIEDHMQFRWCVKLIPLIECAQRQDHIYMYSISAMYIWRIKGTYSHRKNVSTLYSITLYTIHTHSLRYM